MVLASAPAILSGAPRSWSEVEKILASGNVKGKLTKDEVTDVRLHRLFDRADTNKDGVLSREEFILMGKKPK